jgi:hypothetical protein
MHRNEGENMTSGALFPTSPPYGVLTPEFMNAVQEELMNIVTQNNLPLLSKDNDTKSQVWEAIKKYIDTLTIDPPDYRGWIQDNAEWTYDSADAPSYTFNRAGDVTGIMYVGQKILYYQDAAWKYGIITAIGAYAGGVTPITFYGGGNTASPSYAMTASAISTHYYAGVWRPLDFPMNPDTWSYIITDETQRDQSNPDTSIWYNLGSISINIPIGLWKLKYIVAIDATADGANGGVQLKVTLSTANNSESDNYLTFRFTSVIAVNNDVMATMAHRNKIITLASKTTYYLNSIIYIGTNLSHLYNRNDSVPLEIKAVCQYL